jgi:hypothetical protein
VKYREIIWLPHHGKFSLKDFIRHLLRELVALGTNRSLRTCHRYCKAEDVDMPIQAVVAVVFQLLLYELAAKIRMM